MNWQEGLSILHGMGFEGLRHVESRTSSVTTAWGVEWDAELVARDLLQNFFDANRGRLVEIQVDPRGRYHGLGPDRLSAGTTVLPGRGSGPSPRGAGAPSFRLLCGCAVLGSHLISKNAILPA
jgi:hypothetical protein